MKHTIFLLSFLFSTWMVHAQNIGINENGDTPNPSAGLDINFDNKGFLMPRLTASQRDGIVNPAIGLQIYNTDCNRFEHYSGTKWIASLTEESVFTEVSIHTLSSQTACALLENTYVATPVNGGVTPAYQWKVNGVDVGTNSATYTSSTLVEGDEVSCVLTSNLDCVLGSPTVSNVITVEWCCGNEITDIRDGNEYNTVLIGSQCWLKENLKYLPEVNAPSNTSSSAARYYVYGYNGTDLTTAKATLNYSTYGTLYNWSAAMNGSTSSDAVPSGVQGACPTGWHLPSDSEWKVLEMEIGLSESQANSTENRGTNEGNKLKEAGTTHWNSGSAGNNSTGFTALGGGYLHSTTNLFTDIGVYGSFWTSTDSNTNSPWRRNLHYSNTGVHRGNAGNIDSKKYGFSVRCVKD